MDSMNLSDKHPSIKTVSYELKFVDHDGMTKPVENTNELSLPSNSPWKIDCPYIECIDGGFNLSPKLAEAEASQKTKISGTLICNGWQDKERKSKHKCMCNLTFNLYLKYY